MKENIKPSVSITDGMVLVGLGFAAVYWFIDSFVYILYSYEINFFQRLFGPDLGGICTRVVVLCLFIAFGAHAQYMINERKLAEKEMIRYRDQFEELLEKRTEALKRSNEKLQQELAQLKMANPPS